MRNTPEYKYRGVRQKTIVIHKSLLYMRLKEASEQTFSPPTVRRDRVGLLYNTVRTDRAGLYKTVRRDRVGLL